MRAAACIAALCAALGAAAGARAESLGTIGPTYPIVEQNLLDLIMARLREKERSGELRRMEELAKARATQSVTNPKPVPGLRRADTGRTYYYDPTFTLDRNITDENGQMLFPAGMKVNPLDVVSLSKHLLFFDARDPRQVARAKDLIETYQGRVKAILVGGSYPIPTTDKIDGKCCQPFGRTTVLWGAGKEYPVRGEDFAFMLFRKRNCCVGY